MRNVPRLILRSHPSGYLGADGGSRYLGRRRAALAKCRRLLGIRTTIRGDPGERNRQILHLSRSPRAELAPVSEIEIKVLSASPKICGMLSEILIEAVANGGSVSFMHPLDSQTANAFWDDALAAASRNERIVLGAWDGDVLAGTVTLLL